MIQILELSKKYRTKEGEITALDRVNIEVARGEIFGIIGPSGAGKSTLIRTVNLLETPTSGRVIINGEDLTSLKGKGLRRQRQKIGMIFQHFNLLQGRTVRGNISFPLEIAGIPGRERAERVERLIELVGLSSRAGYYPARLSGGEKQRVGIARALANEPELLLSDEATSSLDPESTASVLKLLSRINQELGLTILLITHEMEVVKQVCSRMAVLEQGRVVENGRVSDIFASPEHPLTRKFVKGAGDYILSGSSQKVGGPQKSGSLQETGESQKIGGPQKTGGSQKAGGLQKDGDNLNDGGRQGMPSTNLLLRLEGDGEQLRQGIAYLQRQGLKVEVAADG